jgi:hypothetical protein
MIIVGVKRCAERITRGYYARNLLLLEEFSTICAKVAGVGEPVQDTRDEPASLT